MSFVVWRGHRDYEENVCVCATLERAEEVLRENGVEMRKVPHSHREELCAHDPERTPWGIEVVEDV